jgi:DnaJ-class molecular chaperone
MNLNSFSLPSINEINEAYKILEIPNTSDLTEIKNAYRKKVLITHPDKGGSSNDFILVNQAFELLIKINSPKNKNNLSLNNISELKQITKEKPKTKNMIFYLDITLSEAFFGSKKIIQIKRDKIINNENIIKEIKNLEVYIRKGSFNGCKIIFRGESDECIGFTPGDIIFELKVKNDKFLRRNGSDLFIDYHINLLKSLTGGFIVINLFNKEEINIKLSEIIYPGMKKIIKDKGMPFFNDEKKRGNLVICFFVDFPKTLKDNQINLIKKAFGNFQGQIKKNKGKENFLDKKNSVHNISIIENKNPKNYYILEDYSEEKRNKDYFLY